MAIVKIITEGDETTEEVEEAFVKSILSRNGHEIENIRFDDPLLNTLSDKFDEVFATNYSAMISDIFDVLKQ